MLTYASGCDCSASPRVGHRRGNPTLSPLTWLLLREFWHGMAGLHSWRFRITHASNRSFWQHVVLLRLLHRLQALLSDYIHACFLRLIAFFTHYYTVMDCEWSTCAAVLRQLYEIPTVLG